MNQAQLSQTTQIIIDSNSNLDANYITWSPVPAQIRIVDTGAVTNMLAVKLRNQNPNQGGQVVLFAPFPGPGRGDHGQDELILALPHDGSPVPFFIAGKFGKPSVADKDAVIEVVDTSTGNVLSVTPVMVRIRKNANSLEDGERQRFLSALALLNMASTGGVGGFADYANIHADAGVQEAHGNAGFLPWHRAFMLDLERELQALDPSVSLPYWRFDEAAPNLFTKAFLGVPNPTGTLEFETNNPLQFLSPPIFRQPDFNTTTESAHVINEAGTLQLGDVYANYRIMEGNPHGSAHTSFSGLISNIGTAARDPLFFLLHANVDRLWARWQWYMQRFDMTSIDTYTFLGKAGDSGATRIGHNLLDTMWPWNQITGTGAFDDRPPTAPGGNLPRSKIVNFPSLTPTVGDMIDYQGALNPANRLGFDYDDVPFDFDIL
jgi:Common central domain of tyrosinase.